MRRRKFRNTQNDEQAGVNDQPESGLYTESSFPDGGTDSVGPEFNEEQADTGPTDDPNSANLSVEEDEDDEEDSVA